MPRLPSSLKWLIDRRARVAGEIEKIEASLAKCRMLANELAPLKELLASIDQTMAIHEITIEPALIPVIKSRDVCISLPYGELTRTILLCLRVNSGEPVSTDQITAFLVARHMDLTANSSPLSDLRESVRYRLKNLCRQGLVYRHHGEKGGSQGLWSLSGATLHDD